MMTNQPPRRRLRFPRRFRLRSPLDYKRVFGQRCAVSDAFLVVYVAPNDLDHARLGRSVSRKIGSAVVRNGVRRRIREAFRLNQHRLPAGWDIVVVARGPSAEGAFEAVRSLPILVDRAVAKHRRRRAGEQA